MKDEKKILSVTRTEQIKLFAQNQWNQWSHEFFVKNKQKENKRKEKLKLP